eukprot:scaffold2290_cov170-Amphora_coffeaeformis.AAC.28
MSPSNPFAPLSSPGTSMWSEHNKTNALVGNDGTGNVPYIHYLMSAYFSDHAQYNNLVNDLDIHVRRGRNNRAASRSTARHKTSKKSHPHTAAPFLI